MLTNCSDMNSLNKLISVVINKFDNKFSVGKQEKNNPRLLIKKVNKNVTNNESIVQEICSNGTFENLEQDGIKIVTKLIRKINYIARLHIYWLGKILCRGLHDSVRMLSLSALSTY